MKLKTVTLYIKGKEYQVGMMRVGMTSQVMVLPSRSLQENEQDDPLIGMLFFDETGTPVTVAFWTPEVAKSVFFDLNIAIQNLP